MSQKKSLFQISKANIWKKRAAEMKISGRVHFIEYKRAKSQAERDRLWIEVLAANRLKIPVILISPFVTQNFKKYVKNISQKVRFKKDTAFLFFTSGSTGLPKPVQFTNKMLIAGAKYETRSRRLNKNSNISDFLDPSFSFAIRQFTNACMSGAKFTYIDNEKNYNRVIRDSMDKKITHFTATSVQWKAISAVLKERKSKWKLKGLEIGAGPKNLELLTLLKKHTLAKIHSGYGMTEAGICADLDPSLVNERPTCAGKPLKGTKIRIFKKGGQECGPFEEGDIFFFSKLLSPSVKSPYRTGDLGYKDKSGYLYITGRKEGALKIGGQRVNCEQLEAAYEKYPNCVFGIPADSQGNYEAVVVFETKKSINVAKKYVTEAEPPVNIFCRPKYVLTVSRLPRTITGKIDRLKVKRIFLPEVKKIKNKKKLNAVETEIRSLNPGIKKSLVRIWQEILRAKTISGNKNFFDLGGNSLKALQCAARISDEMGIFLPVVEVFKNPTLQAMAKRIRILLKNKTGEFK